MPRTAGCRACCRRNGRPQCGRGCALGARLTLRAVRVPVRLVWPDHGEVSVGRGDAAVTVTGPPEELALVAFGRQQVARVDYKGSAEAVEQVRGADIADLSGR